MPDAPDRAPALYAEFFVVIPEMHGRGSAFLRSANVRNRLRWRLAAQRWLSRVDCGGRGVVCKETFPAKSGALGCEITASHAKRGAGDEIRTRDIQLGRLTLYQLSYSRGRDALAREMWAGEDSNLRRHKSTDLQSVPVGHFGTCPKNMHRYPLGIVLSWRRDLNPQPAHYK